MNYCLCWVITGARGLSLVVAVGAHCLAAGSGA